MTTHTYQVPTPEEFTQEPSQEEAAQRIINEVLFRMWKQRNTSSRIIFSVPISKRWSPEAQIRAKKAFRKKGWKISLVQNIGDADPDVSYPFVPTHWSIVPSNMEE